LVKRLKGQELQAMQMKISDWLDESEAENLDVSQIALPEDLSYEETS
jgi:hypothetical protein